MVQEKIAEGLKQAETLDEIAEVLSRNRMRIMKKRGWFWGLLHYIVMIVTLGGNKRFREYYTTVGPIIALPYNWTGPVTKSFKAVIFHEAIHVLQFRRMGLGSAWAGVVPFGFLYLLVPLPLFFAWFRWVFEREAYLKGMLFEEKLGIVPRISRAAKQLTSGAYGWALPPCMRTYATKWFAHQLNKAE